MFANAVAGAGLGAAIAWYEHEDVKKSAMVGAAASIGGSALASMTSRPKAAHVVGSALIYTGLKGCCDEYGKGYPTYFMEGLALGIGTQVATSLYERRQNDGSSLLDYTRGQAP